ncbi:hypothetical protein E2C01_083949 [Portunus trituberculatus]|uniref:Uncharacterized protein n=1 Tax=Portunus trituberculatus TaxID=210409 RepID=A0A5B7IU11_PORTR|nr:hypothetical protein [Portunus trituberculatus]
MDALRISENSLRVSLSRYKAVTTVVNVATGDHGGRWAEGPVHRAVPNDEAKLAHDKSRQQILIHINIDADATSR